MLIGQCMAAVRLGGKWRDRVGEARRGWWMGTGDFWGSWGRRIRPWSSNLPALRHYKGNSTECSSVVVRAMASRLRVVGRHFGAC